MKRSFSYYIGNLVIVTSLLGFLFIFYPVILLYVFPPRLEYSSHNATSFSLFIPKINASGNIIAHVDPWNEAVYNEALKKGIAHAKGFALPGEKGTVFLFAHSSGVPWEINRYNTVFFRLGELQVDDEVYIRKDGKRYIYSVIEKKEVWPQEISAVTGTKKDQLIIQTCSPVGTSMKRLLVYAQEKEVLTE